MILSFLFFAFIAYLLYKLVFNFIIPIYTTTRQVKQKFRTMQEQMNGFKNGDKEKEHSHSPSSESKKTSVGDYIDFEEVKD